MKKMLAKAVVLGLVLGGIGFVANDAQLLKSEMVLKYSLA